MQQLLETQANFNKETALTESLNISFVNAAGVVTSTKSYTGNAIVEWKLDLSDIKNLSVVNIDAGQINALGYNVSTMSKTQYKLTFAIKDLNTTYGIAKKSTSATDNQENPAAPKVVNGGLIISNKFQPRKYFQTRSVIIIQPKAGFFENGETYSVSNITNNNASILKTHPFGQTLVSPELDIQTAGYHYFYPSSIEKWKWFKYGENQISFESVRTDSRMVASDKLYIEDVYLGGSISLGSAASQTDQGKLESWVSPQFGAFGFSSDNVNLKIGGVHNIINY